MHRGLPLLGVQRFQWGLQQDFRSLCPRSQMASVEKQPLDPGDMLSCSSMLQKQKEEGRTQLSRAPLEKHLWHAIPI